MLKVYQLRGKFKYSTYSGYGFGFGFSAATIAS